MSTRLRETAEIFTTQPDVMLENYPDVFEGTGASRLRLPVYKVDPAMAELCKKDAPQWIVVSWTAQLNDPVNRKLHDAVLNHFYLGHLTQQAYIEEFVYNYGEWTRDFAGQLWRGRAASGRSATVAYSPSKTFADAGRRTNATGFDVVFHDPPFKENSESDLQLLLRLVRAGGWLFHERGDDKVLCPFGLVPADRRRYGTTRFLIFRP